MEKQKINRQTNIFSSLRKKRQFEKLFWGASVITSTCNTRKNLMLELIEGIQMHCKIELEKEKKKSAQQLQH